MSSSFALALVVLAASLPPEAGPSPGDENMLPVAPTGSSTAAVPPAGPERPTGREAKPGPGPLTREPRPERERDPTPGLRPEVPPAPAPSEPPGPPAPKAPPAKPTLPEGPPLPTGRTLWSVVLLAISLFVLAQALGGLRRGLAEHGVLPRALRVTQVLLRLGAIALLATAALRQLPADLAHVLPWVLVALAAALGWSAREVLPDLLAGLVVLVERRIRRDQWIIGSSFRGAVMELGFRASRIREPGGRILTLPNRRLILEPLEVETGPGPTIEVVVEVPPHLTPARVQRALHEATLLVPWLAPDARIEIRRGERADTWVVHAQLLEGRYEEAFAGALREQVDELRATLSSGVTES